MKPVSFWQIATPESPVSGVHQECLWSASDRETEAFMELMNAALDKVKTSTEAMISSLDSTESHLDRIYEAMKRS